MTTRLIIAPHCDDESLGCGGLLAKHPDECTVAVLSDKGDGRITEFEKARDVLGYSQSVIAPFRTGTLADSSRALTTWLDTVLQEQRPDELYLPTPGVHQDHLAAYEAGMRSARKSYTGSSWFVPSVYLYDIPSYSAELYTVPYTWCRFLSLTEAEMDTKVLAVEAYQSQMVGAFNPARLAREHAEYLGARVSVKYAEQFAVVREVVA